MKQLKAKGEKLQISLILVIGNIPAYFTWYRRINIKGNVAT